MRIGTQIEERQAVGDGQTDRQTDRDLRRPQCGCKCDFKERSMRVAKKHKHRGATCEVQNFKEKHGTQTGTEIRK